MNNNLNSFYKRASFLIGTIVGRLVGWFVHIRLIPEKKYVYFVGYFNKDG